MEKIRQFVNPGEGRVVMCEWNEKNGAWCCQSAAEERFNLCSDKMEPVYTELKGAGYEENR